MVLVGEVPVPGAGAEARRLEHRARTLARRGGGTLITPASAGDPLVLPGVRHIGLQIPPGLDPTKRATAVEDLVGPWLDELLPRIAHIVGLPPAVPALFRRRSGIMTVVEPGVTPAQRLRDEDPHLPAARLEELVALEEKTLQQAHAVVVHSTVQAAAAARRGVRPDRIVIASDGPAELSDPSPPPLLPQLLYLEGMQPWSGWEVLLEALARVKVPWRLTALVTADEPGGQISSRARALGIQGRVAVVRLGDDTGIRASSAQVIVCPLLPSRAVETGGALAEGVPWAVASGRAVVASDFPVVRHYASTAALYVEPGDVGALANGLETALVDDDARTQLAHSAVDLRDRLDWDATADTIIDLWDRLRADD